MRIDRPKALIFQCLRDQANANNRLRDAFPNNIIPSNLIDPVAAKAQTYYPHIGMLRHDSCWFIRAT